MKINQNKLLFKLLITLYIFTLFSCKNKRNNIKKTIDLAYKNSSIKENEKIEIEKTEILEIKNVNFDFLQETKINNLLSMMKNQKKVIELNQEKIKLTKRNIVLNNEMIEIDNVNVGKYTNRIKKEESDLKKFENSIKESENQIAILSQEIVLINAENIENNSKYEFAKYVFIGKINNESRIDTMGFIQNLETDYYAFIKNGKFSNYTGK